MRRAIFERELLPNWRKRLLSEVTAGDLRELCLAIVERGAPATAIHARDITKQIYAFAKLHGEKSRIPPTKLARLLLPPSWRRTVPYRRPKSGSRSSSLS